MIINLKINHSIEKLIKWANKKGYRVEFKRNTDDEIIAIEKLIIINSSYKKEAQLYSFLHECGHALISSNIKSYKKNYKINYDYFFSKKSKNINKISKKFQIALISEEIEAWKRGKKLAKRLNIKINNRIYDEEAHKWIFTYINYAYRRINKKH